MSTLYGVICPYCQKKAYVHVPDTPPPDRDNMEVEVIEETPCPVCGRPIIAFTKASAQWGIRPKKDQT